MWTPVFSCPACRLPAKDATCATCHETFQERDRIWRLLTPARRAALDPFIQQYRAVRAHDGHRVSSPDYYCNLPSVADDDPCALEWQIRRETYSNLLRHFLAAAPQSLRVLDAGAGSGWLAHRLAELGHRPVALDVLDDEIDGLGAARLYVERFALVQADFGRLPFAPGQFDLVVFNASLHYVVSPRETLVGAKAMLAPGGAVAVMDSPMFRDEASGRRMVDAMRDRFRSEYGFGPIVEPGTGYLTFDGLDRWGASLGLRTSFVPSRGSFGWRARRQLARLRLGRAPAAFGLWVAR